MAIDTCVENFSGTVLKSLVASTPKLRPRGDPRPPIPAGIQDEIHLKNRLRKQWQVTRDTALRAEVNLQQRSVTRQLEWRNDQWSATLESRRPIAVEDDETGDEISYSVSPPPWSHWEQSLSQTEKADSLEPQFQPVTDPSVPAVIQMVDVALKSYLLTPASQPKLTNPEEVHEAIRVLKISKASGPNGLPNRVLKHLPQRAVSFLVHNFNAILLTHYIPTMWKRSGDLYPQTGEGFGTALILSAH
jgi:hypothetical protein